jgi:RNA polymerase sigma factor (sigma-70 family)
LSVAGGEGEVARSPDELRELFYAALDRPGDRSGRWLEIWRLVIEHPWYQAELHASARRLVQRSRAPHDCAEDIEHEAILLFAQELRNAPDLHVDRAKSTQHFSGWLATIIERDCLRAMRGTRRRQRLEKVDKVHVKSAEARPVDLDEMIDLAAAFDKLPDEHRTVLLMRLDGLRIIDIAERLNTSKSRIGRVVQEALSLLTTSHCA